MNKIIAEELGRDYIRLSIRLWGILTSYNFDIGNVGLLILMFTF